MPKGQRTFTKEFKVEAVRFVKTSGKSISQVERDLAMGIKPPRKKRFSVSNAS